MCDLARGAICLACGKAVAQSPAGLGLWSGINRKERLEWVAPLSMKLSHSRSLWSMSPCAGTCTIPDVL